MERALRIRPEELRSALEVARLGLSVDYGDTASGRRIIRLPADGPSQVTLPVRRMALLGYPRIWGHSSTYPAQTADHARRSRTMMIAFANGAVPVRVTEARQAASWWQVACSKPPTGHSGSAAPLATFAASLQRIRHPAARGFRSRRTLS